MVMTDMTSATTVPAAQDGWAEVVDEITRSCKRRAADGQLLEGPGVVGVLAGAAPVVWVHGPTDATRLTEALARSAEVDEVYVAAAQEPIATTLGAAGWTCTETVTQMIHRGADVPQIVSGLPAVHALQPGDLADVRDLMRRHAGVDESMLEHSYGDDFFVVAAPVWLFGARDGAGRLVGQIALRRQGRSAMGFGLTVDPAWRSTGLSTVLVGSAVRQAMAVGAEFVHAQARPTSARRLTDCGFAGVGAWLRLVRG
jgi:GNAT superfamily N-acetyltransferase